MVQLQVVKPVITVEVEEASELSDTRRGVGGFGSTGNQKNIKVSSFGNSNNLFS